MKVKPPPPKPQIIHPPNLPPKGSDVWNNCMLLVDKPLKWTSQDVCGKLKRTLDVKKIGHAGTLDPLATGLLIICIGKGTKSSELFMASEKMYTGTMKLGEATPSYDTETEPCSSAPWRHLKLEQLQAVADRHFVGDIQQVPPAYSAIKVGGQRSWRAVRAGKPLDIAPRLRHVFEYQLSRDDEHSPYVAFRVRCGKGTYVRSLVHDLVRPKCPPRPPARALSAPFSQSCSVAWAMCCGMLKCGGCAGRGSRVQGTCDGASAVPQWRL